MKRDFWSKRFQRPQLMAGLLIILAIAVIAFLAPVIAPQDPGLMHLQDRFQRPSLQHPFGLDQNGSDVLAQVAYGARVSLSVALSVVGICSLLGLLIGSISGWRGGWIDNLLMRFIDMIHAFPGFLLALAMVAVLGPSLPNLVLALCLTGWTGYARLVRGEVLHLKTREYVIGAMAVGGGPWRVLRVHIWPNLLGLLVVQATFGMAGTILTETGLSFLGLGAPPSVPTWGSLLSAGRRSLVEAPHLSFFPGAAIVSLVLGFHLCGEGLRDWLNPRR